MNWLYNMKIGAKLTAAFLLVSIIVGIIGGVGFSSLNEVGNVRLPSVSNLLEMEKEFVKIGTNENSLVNPKLTYEERQQVYQQLEESSASLKQYWDAYSALPMAEEEKVIWAQFETAYASWLQSHEAYIALSKKLDEKGIDDPQQVRYQVALQQRDHYNWIWKLSESIDGTVEFEGELDPEKCGLSLWLQAYSPRSEQFISLAQSLLQPHQKVHESGTAIKDTLKGEGINKKWLARNLYDTQVVPFMNSALDLLAQMDALAEASDGIYNEMLTLSTSTVRAKYDETAALLESLVKLNEKIAADVIQSSSLMIIVILVGGIALSMLLGWGISSIIRKPINKLADASKKIADGDLDVSIDIHTRDEMGNLAASFRRMSENLHEVMSNIDAASEQVFSGARQVSQSSQALSQGATEQASSIEELTSSLEQIASQTRLNAQNANEANKLAGIAQGDALLGNAQMKDMVKAMAEINESSANISKIIKVIDEIAFQTNILALNAAVEAARAGQQGKGFAVVAEEVRNLAARSAKAASETTDLIESSIHKVEAGTKLAANTEKALEKIVEGVSKAAALVGNIDVASNEQAAGIAQINQAVLQVSKVVQANSAASEQSAAASKELANQSDLMRESVSKFNLRKADRTQKHYDMAEAGMHSRQEKQTGVETVHPKAKAEKPIIRLSDDEFGKY